LSRCHFVSYHLQDWLFHHVPDFPLMPVPYRCGLTSFIAIESVNSYLGLSLHHQVTRREPQVDSNCSSWNRFHGTCPRRPDFASCSDNQFRKWHTAKMFSVCCKLTRKQNYHSTSGQIIFRCSHRCGEWEVKFAIPCKTKKLACSIENKKILKYTVWTSIFPKHVNFHYQLQLPWDANNETNWLNWKNCKM
jgi:hypothetical protein